MTGEREASESAYAALTDETRVRILLTLADQYDEAWASRWPTFSELRERVGVEDTSRFSYHLSELQDDFIQKVDGRYRPGIAALEIVAAIRAGSYMTQNGDKQYEIQEQETEYECPHCDRDLVAAYQEHHLYIGCPDHGAAVAYPTPPRATENRSLDAVIDATLQNHACDVRLLRNGICPHCWGSAGLSLSRDSVPESYLYRDVPYATAACGTCWLSYPIPTAQTILGHHAVEALYAAHGLRPRDAQIGPHSLTEVSNVSTDEAVPTAARVEVGLADGSVEFDLDENCRIRRYDASDTEQKH
jgi:DNA-binding transcriptional ArsR family regulator